MLVHGRPMRLFAGFFRNRAGISAIEFAIASPVIILLLVFGFDTARFIVSTEKIVNVASTIGQMISQNTTGTVNYVDVQFYRDSAMVIFPQVLADAKQQSIPWYNDISITMSSINFVASPSGCTTTCTYTPEVVWSGGSNPRSCTAPITSVSDTAAPSPTTLPVDVYGAGSLIAVDVSFQFKPTIAPSFMKNINISRSYYLAPRFVPLIKYAVISGDNGIASECPKY